MSFAVQLPAAQIPSVSLIEGRPATTSLAIAGHFGKTHSKVLRDIDKLIASCPDDFRESNFGFTLRDVACPNGAVRHERFANVYFDGFMLLVMGYTGKKALAMKLAYIEAFNAMREQLEKPEPQPALPPVDAPITPDQQCTLRAIVKAKVEAIPESERPRGLYPQIWSRFNNHFRIARYCQLPQTRLSEAVEYLTQMEFHAALPAKPEGLPVPVEPAVQLRTIAAARQKCRFEFIPKGYAATDLKAAQRSKLCFDLYQMQDNFWAMLYNICSAIQHIHDEK